ncbi:MAG: winged helix-turn-helix transcriptional regulator [Hydrogenibacillus sp.]|nr:winged helix-turn-helix transcriptional regulator [Hydrogenibacillus sp.]
MPTDDELDIAKRIVIGLNKIGLALRHHAWQKADKARLTPTQGQILSFLDAHADECVGTSAVAEALALTRPTASEAIHALVQKGWVKREPSPADGRAACWTLTEAGRRQAEAAKTWADFLLPAVAALDPNEQVIFLRSLTKMIRVLQVQQKIPIAAMCVTCRFFRPCVHDDPHKPHHCAFVDAPLGDRDLQLMCSDHETADEAHAAHVWNILTQRRRRHDDPRVHDGVPDAAAGAAETRRD